MQKIQIMINDEIVELIPGEDGTFTKTYDERPTLINVPLINGEKREYAFYKSGVTSNGKSIFIETVMGNKLTFIFKESEKCANSLISLLR